MSTRSNSVPSGEAHALYLHIPFCRHRCSYFDFNTYTTVGELQAPFTGLPGPVLKKNAAHLRP